MNFKISFLLGLASEFFRISILKILTLCVGSVFLFSNFSYGADKSKEKDPDGINDLYDIPKLSAVQNRAYLRLSHRLDLDLSYLPVDSFNKGFTAGLAYSFALSEFTSWEVVNFAYNFNSETPLKSDLHLLRPALNGQNRPWLDYVDYFVTTSLVYTPIYTKNLMFNKSTLRGEISFLLGGGMAAFHDQGSTAIVSTGLILSYFLGQRTSLHFDAREHIYFSSGANGILSLVLGLGYQFGSEVTFSNPQGKESRRNDEAI